MFSVIIKGVDEDYSVIGVKDKSEIRKLLGTEGSSTETIPLEEGLLLFYNFYKLQEIGQMTGSVHDKDEILSFFCGDFIVARVDCSELLNITDEDIEFVKKSVRL